MEFFIFINNFNLSFLLIYLFLLSILDFKYRKIENRIIIGPIIYFHIIFFIHLMNYFISLSLILVIFYFIHLNLFYYLFKYNFFGGADIKVLIIIILFFFSSSISGYISIYDYLQFLFHFVLILILIPLINMIKNNTNLRNNQYSVNFQKKKKIAMIPLMFYSIIWSFLT